MNLNKVQLIGHLGADPALNTTTSGTAVANLSVATSYKPKNGDQQTEWHRVTVFGKTAENCEQYLSKGSLVYVEGRLQTRKWKDKEGNDRYTTEIVAFSVLFLDKKEKSSSDGPPHMDDDDVPF